MRNNVDYSLIERRNKCVHSIYEMSDRYYLTESSSPGARDSFFRSCASCNNANKYYEKCISMLESGQPDNYKLAEVFVKDVIPHIDNMDALRYTVEQYKSIFSIPVYRMLENAVEQYAVADRILENNEKINDKCDINNRIHDERNHGTRRICKTICEAVDMFELKEHARLNVALEECSYLLDRNKIRYKKSEMVQSVLEYFLMRDGGIDDQTQNKFRKVLKENSCIADNDLSKVIYFTEGYDDCKLATDQMLHKFTMSADKEEFGGFTSICNKIPNSDLYNGGLSSLLAYVRDNMFYTAYEIEAIVDDLDRLTENIVTMLKENPTCFSKEELALIIKTYTDEITNVDRLLYDCKEQDLGSKLVMLKDSHENSIKMLTPFYNNMYPQYNIECMTHASKVITETMYLNEFKIFKFDNMLKLAAQAEKLIKGKANILSTKLKNALNIENKLGPKGTMNRAQQKAAKKAKELAKKRNKKKPILDLSLGECVTSESTIDILVERFDLIDEEALPEIHEVMNDICKEINEGMLANNTACCYYTILPDAVEIHMEDAASLLLNDAEEYDIKNQQINREDAVNMIDVIETATILDEMDYNRATNLSTEINEATSWIDRERFDLIMEAASYSGLLNFENIEEFARNYVENNSLDADTTWEVMKMAENWESEEDIPLEVQVEAYDIICSLLETDEEKDEINKKKKEEDEKEEKKSILDKIKEKLPGKKEDTKDSDKKDEKEDSESKDDDNDSTDEDDKKSGDGEKKDSDKEEKKESIVDKIKDKLPGKKDDEDGEKKGKSSGLNINSLKLALKGLKGKIKDLDSKAKNISNNMDMEANRLMKSIKDSLTNDRREGIITGSVVPSFKRCMKWGVALAGLGLATANPAIPAIAAVGGLAISKNLNRKERLLLMDEIDTELEVVDKEIELAQSRNQIKKYRELLNYKKELQRQYQRIKYNTRVGKDLMPGVTTGLPEDRK